MQQAEFGERTNMQIVGLGILIHGTSQPRAPVPRETSIHGVSQLTTALPTLVRVAVSLSVFVRMAVIVRMIMPVVMAMLMRVRNADIGRVRVNQ